MDICWWLLLLDDFAALQMTSLLFDDFAALQMTSLLFNDFAALQMTSPKMPKMVSKTCTNYILYDVRLLVVERSADALILFYYSSLVDFAALR